MKQVRGERNDKETEGERARALLLAASSSTLHCALSGRDHWTLYSSLLLCFSVCSAPVGRSVCFVVFAVAATQAARLKQSPWPFFPFPFFSFLFFAPSFSARPPNSIALVETKQTNRPRMSQSATTHRAEGEERERRGREREREGEGGEGEERGGGGGLRPCSDNRPLDKWREQAQPALAPFHTAGDSAMLPSLPFSPLLLPLPPADEWPRIPTVPVCLSTHPLSLLSALLLLLLCCCFLSPLRQTARRVRVGAAVRRSPGEWIGGV